MTTEIIKGVIAVIVFAAGITSLFVGDGGAQQYLIPLATFVFGYYFKQSVELPIARKIASRKQ